MGVVWNQADEDSNMREQIEIANRLNGGWAFVRVVLLALACAGGVLAFSFQPKYPVETHHNVYVWSQVKGTQESWWVSGNDLPFSKWKCCPDFNCSAILWPGYIATTLKYEERGVCKSIRASGLGWFWERDERGNVKEW
jgi:hypothetical protein